MKKQLINEVARMKRLAGLITESQYEALTREGQLSEGIKTIDANSRDFKAEGDEDLKPTDLKPGVMISVIKYFGDKAEFEDNAGKFDRIEGNYIYWKTKSGKEKSWSHIEDLALVKNLEMTESQTNEIFGLGAKGSRKVNDIVKIKDSNADWRIEKFLGKTEFGEKYRVQRPGTDKVQDIYANQIVSESNLSEYQDLGQGDDRNYETKDHIYNTFKEWLEGLIERHGNEKKGSLGVAAQIKTLTKGNMDATPEDFIAQMMRWGSGTPKYINFYSEDGKIIGKGTYPYGEWDMTKGERGMGVVYPPTDETPSSLIYPKSDNETDKRSGYGDSFDRST